MHLKDGRIRYIEGNPRPPGQQGRALRQGLAPASCSTTRRPGCASRCCASAPRGSGEFEEIELGRGAGDRHRLAAATSAQTDPRKLAFFTGRDQCQALTGWWAAQFGTPNFAAHGGFCSVNMAAGGLYTIGGSFWEFGEPDWDRTNYFLMFGVAEDHDSNPIKIGLGKLKARGAKFVSVNPVPHRLFRHRRRMDRHPARHRRAVRAGAGP